MSVVKWHRSDEGYVDSHCGRWKIRPLYWGSVRAQSYELINPRGKKCGWFETQSEAKAYADQLEVSGRYA